MLVVAIAFILFAAIMLVAGLRGHVLDDHPVCRACRFDLVGIYPTALRCPECGRSLDPNASPSSPNASIQFGNRRRRPVMLALSALVGALGLALGTVAIGTVVAGKNANALKPTWWLLLDIRAGSGPDVDAALVELLNRHNGGTLSRDHLQSIAKIGLARQADLSTPWLSHWGECVEAAWNTGVLSAEQRTQYAQNALGLRLLVRNPVIRGDILPVSVALEPRIGPGNLFSFELRMLDFRLNALPLEPQRFYARGSVDDPPGAPSTLQVMDIAPSSAFGTDLRSAQQHSRAEVLIGTHTVSAKWDLKITQRDPQEFGRGWSAAHGPSLPGEEYRPMSPDLDLPVYAELQPLTTAPVTVVETAPAIELFHDPALAQRIRDSICFQIRPQPARYRQVTQGAKTFAMVPSAGAFYAISQPPIDMAFTVTIKTSDGEEVRAFLRSARNSGSMGEINIPRMDPAETVEITLTPNPEAARMTIGMTRIWGEPIVFRDLKVEEDPSNARSSKPLPFKHETK